jgi:CTP:phosphocholine cytidylyltransferase-like protein
LNGQKKSIKKTKKLLIVKQLSSKILSRKIHPSDNTTKHGTFFRNTMKNKIIILIYSVYILTENKKTFDCETIIKQNIIQKN